MNETDVREEIVRPLITRLGYKHGADSYVQTELPLTYSQAFLGEKKPTKDPALKGRADYICGVVAAGKWVIEVKRPDKVLDEATVQQAHTYAAHPEVAAYYFMVSNGKSFAVYEVGRLQEPLLSWTYLELEEKFLNIENLLGPEAIQKRSKLTLVDPGKPLGKGLSSRLEILNGSVTYASSSSPQPPFISSLANVQLPVSGGWVARDTDGRIHARVDVGTVSPLLRTAGAIGLADNYDFYSSSPYISTDSEHPTIFQNFLRNKTERGTSMNFAGMVTPLPFSIEMNAFTEVVGFVKEDVFQGTMRIEADLQIGPMDQLVGLLVANQFGIRTGKHTITQLGRFSARLGSVI